MADETRKDYVAEAYETFIKNASDLDPSDPVAAIQAYFDKNASDDLKARAQADGKTAKDCWKFIEAVARKALHGHSGHIDPAAIYAIAMHWFEDVPKDWNGVPAAEVPAPAKPKKEKPKKAPKPKRAKFQQGFFFDILEVAETEKADPETKQADPETEKADPETKQADPETKQADPETKQAETETKQANAETEAANAD